VSQVFSCADWLIGEHYLPAHNSCKFQTVIIYLMYVMHGGFQATPCQPKHLVPQLSLLL